MRLLIGTRLTARGCSSRASCARTAAVSASRGLLAEPPLHSRSYSPAEELFDFIRSPPSAAPHERWAEYLLARGWLMRARYAAAPVVAQHAAVDVLSAALSFPLTLAAAWDHLVPSHIRERAVAEERPIRLSVVGARAEATLPTVFWRELSLLTGVPSVAIDFCGPASAPSQSTTASRMWCSPPQRLEESDSAPPQTLELTHTTPADLFHRGAVGAALLRRHRGESSPPEAEVADAYALFNPGFGEPGWETAWSETLHALEAADRPLLATAFSRADATRDHAFLGRELPRARVEYVDNPWASTLLEDAKGETAIGSQSNFLVCAVTRLAVGK